MLPLNGIIVPPCVMGKYNEEKSEQDRQIDDEQASGVPVFHLNTSSCLFELDRDSERIYRRLWRGSRANWKWIFIYMVMRCTAIKGRTFSAVCRVEGSMVHGVYAIFCWQVIMQSDSLERTMR